MALISILLNHGVDITLGTPQALSPLHWLATNPENNVGMINTLLRGREHLVNDRIANDYVADPTWRGETPLMRAVDAMVWVDTHGGSEADRNNILANARALLENGADVEARYPGPGGNTILARAQLHSPRMYALFNEYGTQAERKQAVVGAALPDSTVLADVITSYEK